MGTITVFIADDHTLFRQGITQIIDNDNDFRIAGEAKSIEEILASNKIKESDVLILDISFGEESSISALPDIKRKNPDINIIILSMHDKPMLIKKALNLGAAGYIIKSSPASQLLEAIKTVSSGKKYIDSALSDSIFTLLNEKIDLNDSNSLYNLLTNREQEIFRLLAGGDKPATIARVLNISRKTAENHRTNIQNKLQLDSMSDITVFAKKIGVI